jgi:small subunit ribosomal protein S5
MVFERKNRKPREASERQPREFDQKVVEVSRVTRVVAGGKRMRFRALVVIGDRKGRVGVGLRKGADVSESVNKAVNDAKKNMVTVPLINDTIPHEVVLKYKSSRIILHPARQGSGVIAGGAIRSVMEMAGVKNVMGKMMGSSNKVNNVRAALLALKSLKSKKAIDSLKK